MRMGHRARLKRLYPRLQLNRSRCTLHCKANRLNRMVPHPHRCVSFCTPDGLAFHLYCDDVVFAVIVSPQHEGKGDGFCDIPLDGTPKVSPLGAAQVTPTPDTHSTHSSSQYQQQHDVSVESNALPAWESEDSEYSGDEHDEDEDDGEYSDDVDSSDQRQIHYVDQHAHAH